MNLYNAIDFFSDLQPFSNQKEPESGDPISKNIDCIKLIILSFCCYLLYFDFNQIPQTSQIGASRGSARLEQLPMDRMEWEWLLRIR